MDCGARTGRITAAKLARTQRYNAALAAARAGQHEQALAWLRAALPTTQPGLLKRFWLNEPSFRKLRKLDPKLWAEVERRAAK